MRFVLRYLFLDLKTRETAPVDGWSASKQTPQSIREVRGERVNTHIWC